MDGDKFHLRNALVAALRKALQIVAAKSHERRSAQLVWKLQGSPGWVGSHEERLEIVWGFCALSDQIDAFNELKEAFEAEIPWLLGSTVRVESLIRAKCKLYTILSGLVFTIWDRYGSLVVDVNAMQEVIDDFFYSIETRTITFGYLAPIRDFRMLGVDTFIFPNGVQIRQLRESEANRLYGGIFPAFKSSFAPPGLFTFAGEIEQRFAVADEPDSAQSLRALVSNAIATVEEIMMSHKAGRVVHDWISITFAKPSPTGTLNMGIDASPRPAKDCYELTEADLSRISNSFRLVTTAEFPALTTACKRLADSERRTNAADAIMDAVIGLEMLLLGGPDREGLRFRFALNYATLSADHSPTVRRLRFKTASDKYKARSQLVHAGTRPHKLIKIADESLAIKDVARKAKEMLRTTIDAFLRLEVPARSNERERWFDNFWESGYFALR